MALQPFAFRKTISAVIGFNGSFYKIDLYPDITFSQTFDEQAISVKTLHAQADMFDAAVINKANPANFSFTMPLRYDGANQNAIVPMLLLQYKAQSSEVTLNTFDIYVESNGQYFKLTNCVIERGTYAMARDAIVTLEVSGTASRLQKIANPSLNPSYNTSPNYFFVERMGIYLNDNEQSNIYSVTVEVNNDVNWVANNTLHKSLAVTGPSNTTYPEAFVVSKRSVSGTIVKYLKSDEDPQDWSIYNNLLIYMEHAHGSLNFFLPSIVFTSRLDVQDIFLKSYDFRLNATVADLTSNIY